MDRHDKAKFAARERQQEEAAYRAKLARDNRQLELEDIPPADLTDGLPLQSALRGQLKDAAALRRYLEAGRAVFTIRSRTSGTRFTFKATRPDAREHEQRQAPGALPRARPIWLKVLTGPDNVSNYAFVGTLWPEAGGYRYAHSPKSQLHLTAPSVVAVRWLAHALSSADSARLLQQAEVWHEGRCGRCGRRLTVPESIDTGFGPECAGILGVA